MRARLLALALLAIAAGGATVQAQGDRPLMVNEVASWCEDNGLIEGTACDRASYASLPDGSLRVVLNFYAEGGRLDDDNCVTGMHIPSDVTGWAYTINGETRGVVTITEVTSETAVCELIVSR